MSNIIKKIEDAMMAASFAEAGEHGYARDLLGAGKNSHKKVLLSTDCPVVTGKVLDHAFNLCKRLGSALEVYQIIPMDISSTSPQEFFEKGTRRLQSLQEKMKQLGISYKYSMKQASLQDELTVLAGKRRDIMAVIIPVCDGVREQDNDFKSNISGLFRCPVIFFES